MEMKLQKICLKYYNLLTEQFLWQVLYHLSVGIHKIKFNHTHANKNCETCGIKCKYCDWFLGYVNFKDALK